MKKIAALRDHLLESALDIQPEDIIARVSEGQLRHHYRHPDAPAPPANDKIQLIYSAELLIMDYTGAPEAVFYLVAQWLSAWQPGHKNDCISIKAEILDNNSADLLITITGLTDTYNPVIEQDGTRIHNCPPKHLNRQTYP